MDIFSIISSIFRTSSRERLVIFLICLSESVDKLLNSDKVHTNTINEPISSLIDYVKDKYNQDLSEEVKEYESKINRDKQE